MAFTPEFQAAVGSFAAHGKTETHRLCLAAVRIAAEFGQVTSDEIREFLPDLTGDMRIVGGALGQLKRKGVLMVVGHRQTGRKASHGRPISVFALAPDWRSRWIAEDLPVPSELVNLNTPFTEASKQVPMEEVIRRLGTINRLARELLDGGVLLDVNKAQEIVSLTEVWAKEKKDV